MRLQRSWRSILKSRASRAWGHWEDPEVNHPLDRFHLSWSDVATAERAAVLWSCRPGVPICCETSSIVSSNLGFIKMEPNFMWKNHIQLEMWGTGGKKIVLNLKTEKEQESQHENSCWSDGTRRARMAVSLNCACNHLLKCQPVIPEMATFL